MREGVSLLDRLSEDALWRLEEICLRFETAWLAGQRPRPEDSLAGLEGAERLAVLRELLRLDLHYRRQAGEDVHPEEYGTRFPDANTILGEIFSREIEGSHRTTDASPEPEQALSVQTVDEVPVGDSDAASPSEVPDSADTGSSRYQRLRFHAAGNLGEVFVAEDLELHREVALKEIQPQHAQRKDSRGRFVLEAEVTGRLEHPGIVPVYGLGMYPDGRPFYAMRFIRGHTLAQAIAQFHGRAPVRFDSLEFRQLLGRFVAVCQAMAYAHGQGVLHRDLKPANIMLGEFGETLIVDWGLAKVFDRSESKEDSQGGGGRPRASMGGGLETVAGSVVGTPAYMSPEQAAGTVAELGPATDVYGLGATLYVLLTGKTAFQGPVLDILKNVEKGEWLPARRVNATVPATLEAICGKAMARRPEDRYASALTLAQDLERWLADEPVGIYREPIGARLRRWMRKHPRKVTAAGVLLLALVVGLVAGTVVQEQRKREAEENFRITREAAQKFLVAVNEEDLLNEPGMQPLRMKLLVQALDYYKAFLEKRPGDPDVRQERANANRQLGELYGEKRRMAEAKSLVRWSLKEYGELREKAPDDAALKRGRAQALLAQADLRVRSGESAAGREDADQAIQLLESLNSERKDDTGLLNLLGRAYDERATAQSQVGQLEKSIQDNAKAGRLFWRALLVLFQENHGLQWGLIRHESGIHGELLGQFPAAFLVSRAWLNQGKYQQRHGQDASAVRSFNTAARSAKWLQGKYPYLEFYNPRLARLRIGVAAALLNAGHAEVELGHPGAGQVALLEALELSRGFLKDASPERSAEYKAILSQAAGYTGEDLFRSGQTTRAAALLHEAELVATEVSKDDSKSQTLRGQRGHILSVLGRLEGERGNLDNGLRYCEQARLEQEQAIQAAPWDRILCNNLLNTREAIARLRIPAGQHGSDAWAREQRLILAERRDLARRGTSLPYFQREVGASAAVLTGLLLENGQAGEALALVEEMLPPIERLVREDRLLARLGARENNLPKTDDFHSSPRLKVSTLDYQGLPGDFSDRRPLHEPEDFQLRRVWAELLARKGAALARLGQGAAAAECVGKAIALVEELVRGDGYLACPPPSWESLWPFLALQASRREPCYLYDLACHLTLASALPGHAGQPDPATRAVQALRELVAAGFDNPYKLRTDQRLFPLRLRDDYRKLVLDLETHARGGTEKLPEH